MPTTLNIGSQVVGCADGYGNATEQIILALEARGVRCIVDWTAHPVGDVRVREVLSREYEEGDARLYFVQPYAWDRRTRQPIFGFTMYESDRLPDHWLPRMGNADELWVPSTWNQEVFSAATGRPTHLVPLGVNAGDFPRVRRQRGPVLRVLTFSTQAAELRKGTALAIRAFETAFRDRRDVSLTIRSTWDFKLALDDPRVSLAVGPLSTADLAAFYGQFDVLLFPSRSEGFGLIPLEFMATGAPAIFADATGMHDYATFGLPVSAMPAPAYIGIGRSASAEPWGSWYEPDFDELIDRLRQVDTEYEAVQQRAYDEAAIIGDAWSWDRTAQHIIARLNARG